MGRRIRRTVLVLSLVLSVASIALWVRSHYWRDAIDLRQPAHGMAIRSENGSVRVYLRSTDRGRGVEASAWRVSDANDPFAFENNPFHDQTEWNWNALTFQAGASPPAFEWERMQAPPPTGGTVTVYSGGAAIVMSAPAGARPTVGDDYLRVTLPHWLPVLVFGFLPALTAVRFMTTHWRRYRRLLAGACPICAYDLRATPGRCPECGWTVSASRDASKRLPQTPAPSPDAAPR